MGCWGSLVIWWGMDQRVPRGSPCGSREKKPGFGDRLVRLWGVPVGTVRGVCWRDLSEVDGDCLVNVMMSTR